MSFQLPASCFQKMRARLGFPLTADSWQLKATGEAGFTLIELLVVTGIIVVVSAVVLVNQNKFGGQVLLQNFAYDVALSIRQAQVYGLAVARKGTGSSATFGAPYGIHFEIDDPSTTGTDESKIYHLFADVDQNGVESASGERVQTLNIRRGYEISNLCTSDTVEGDDCNKEIDIIFQRPEPDAKISWIDEGNVAHNCFAPNPKCADSATITLRSPRGDTMSVVVDLNGQISVTKQ